MILATNPVADGVELVITNDTGPRRAHVAQCVGWRVDPGPGNSSRVPLLPTADHWQLGSVMIEPGADGVVPLASIRHLPGEIEVSIAGRGTMAGRASDVILLQRVPVDIAQFQSRCIRLKVEVRAGPDVVTEDVVVAVAGQRSDTRSPSKADPYTRPERWCGLERDPDVALLVAQHAARGIRGA